MQPDLDAIAALKQQDSIKLHKELVVTAIHECRKYGWGGVSPYGFVKENTNLSSGESPMDIASKALTDTIAGVRPWDKEKYPDIRNHLKWAITSIVNNLANSAENRTTTTFSGLATDESPDGDGETWSLSAEERGLLGKITEYDEVESQEFIDAVIDEFHGDNTLEAVLEYSMSGLTPSEISEKLNLPISATYQLTRKIVRKVKKIIKNREMVPGGIHGERRDQ